MKAQIGWLIVGALVVTVLFLTPRGTLRLAVTPTPSQSTATQTSTAPVSDEKLLKVISWRCERSSSDYLKIIGEVRNQSSEVLENVEARGQIKDSAGLVAKNEVLIDYKLLRPGEVSPFEVLIDTGGREGQCYLNFGFAFGGPIPTDLSE